MKAVKKDIFDINKVTVVGSPTITGDGVASGFSLENYITHNCASIPLPQKSWECSQIIETWKEDLTTYQMYSSFGTHCYLRINGSGSNFGIEIVIDGVRKNLVLSPSRFEKGTKYEIVYGQKLVDGNYYLFLKYRKVGDEIFDVHENTTEYSKFFNISSYLLYLGVFGTSTPSYPVIDGSIDLTAFKIYVDGQLVYSPTRPITFLERRKEGFDLSKFTVIGSPTITEDGIASGFSHGNYVETTEIVDFSKDWEIKTKIKTGEIIDAQTILVLSSNITSGGDYVVITGQQKVSLRLSGSLSDFANLDTGSLLPLTEYFIIIGKKENVYYIKVIEIDSDTVNENTRINENNLANYKIRIGSNDTWFFRGSIDLKQFSITVDGKEVFTGAKEKFYAIGD